MKLIYLFYLHFIRIEQNSGERNYLNGRRSVLTLHTRFPLPFSLPYYTEYSVNLKKTQLFPFEHAGDALEI